jgi:hypothetical protein
MAKRPDESRVKITWALFQEICTNLELTGAKYKSCELSGVKYGGVMDAINAQAAIGDLEWQELWDESYAKFLESVKTEVRSRAVDGWNEPVFHMGKVVGYVQKKSDRLLELMATKLHPEFANKSEITVNHQGQLGGGLDVFKQLSLDAKKRIRDIIMEDLEAQRVKAAEQHQVISQQKLEDHSDV